MFTVQIKDITNYGKLFDFLLKISNIGINILDILY